MQLIDAALALTGLEHNTYRAMGLTIQQNVEANSANHVEPGELNLMDSWNQNSPVNHQRTYLSELLAHIAPYSHTARVKINWISLINIIASWILR